MNLSIFAASLIALNLSAVATTDNLKKTQADTSNSQQRMEKRINNSSIIYGADTQNKENGQEANFKDTRPQGTKYNRDNLDVQAQEEE